MQIFVFKLMASKFGTLADFSYLCPIETKNIMYMTNKIMIKKCHDNICSYLRCRNTGSYMLKVVMVNKGKIYNIIPSKDWREDDKDRCEKN